MKVLQLKVGKLEDMTAGAADRIVIRQQPLPGNKATTGSPVDMIVGLWSDLEAQVGADSPEDLSSSPADSMNEPDDDLKIDSPLP